MRIASIEALLKNLRNPLRAGIDAAGAVDSALLFARTSSRLLNVGIPNRARSPEERPDAALVPGPVAEE